MTHQQYPQQLDSLSVCCWYSLKMQLLLFTLSFAISNAFILPRIFKSGMVLQAKPTDAVIWGFLQGNMNPVDFYLLCPSTGKKLKKTYIPTKVTFYKKVSADVIMVMDLF